MENFYKLIFIFGFVCFVYGKWDGNCNMPPELSSDIHCCNDSLFDEEVALTKTCATKYGIALNANNDPQFTPANMDTLVCFADCIFTTDKYIVNGAFDWAFIKKDITDSAKAAPELGTTLYAAMEKCNKNIDKVTEAIKKMPGSDKILKGKCPPLAQLIMMCSDLEYTANCPAKYWAAAIPECADMKDYATKCKLAA